MKRKLVIIIFTLVYLLTPIAVWLTYTEEKIELETPSNLKTVELLGGDNLLTWSDVKGAEEYRIYCSHIKDGEYKQIGSSTGCFYMVNVKNDGRKCYYVKAVKKKRTKEYSSNRSRVIETNKPKPTLTPKPTLAPKPTLVPTLTPKPTLAPIVIPTKPPKSVPIAKVENGFQAEVLRLVNIEREKAGRKALTMDTDLTSPANKRAKEISVSFSHTRPDGNSWSSVLNDYNITPMYAGENLAYGYSSAQNTVAAWMNSEGHRANILNANFFNIGIGVYESGGTIYCTQLFTD